MLVYGICFKAVRDFNFVAQTAFIAYFANRRANLGLEVTLKQISNKFTNSGTCPNILKTKLWTISVNTVYFRFPHVHIFIVFFTPLCSSTFSCVTICHALGSYFNFCDFICFQRNEDWMTKTSYHIFLTEMMVKSS